MKAEIIPKHCCGWRKLMVLMLVYFAISSKKSTHDLFSSIFLMLFFCGTNLPNALIMCIEHLEILLPPGFLYVTFGQIYRSLTIFIENYSNIYRTKYIHYQNIFCGECDETNLML
jgi:hypothetical protein